MTAYEDFLTAKARLATSSGLDIGPADVHPALKPHQRDAVVWAARCGHPRDPHQHFRRHSTWCSACPAGTCDQWKPRRWWHRRRR